MNTRMKVLFTVVVGLLVFGSASAAQAQDLEGFSTTLGLPQGTCIDTTFGGGYVNSPTGSGRAWFGFLAGFPFGANSAPTAAVAWKDKAAGLTMTAFGAPDYYVGYNCHNADSTACYDRVWAGYAKVSLPGFNGVLPYLIEIIDNFGSPIHRDWLHMAVGNYVVAGEIISGGSIKVQNPSSAPNCQ